MNKCISILLLSIGTLTAAGQQPSYSDSMMLYYGKSDFEKAIYWGEKNAAALRHVAKDTTYASAINNLGFFYFQNGQINESVPYFKEASQIWKAYKGDTSNNYLFILQSLADAYQKAGNYRLAEETILQSINGRRLNLDTVNLNFANSLALLGLIYKQTSRFQPAQAMYRQCMALFDKMGSSQTADYAKALNSLGTLYFATGQYKLSEINLQKSAAMHKAIFGATHWEYTVIANNLGSLYYTLGNYASAADVFAEILPVVKNQLGENHPLYATVTGNLAVVYQQLGSYEKALPFMLQQLQVYSVAPGRQSAEYAATVNNLGNLYFRLFHNKEARQYFEEALKLRKALFGEQNNLYAMALNNMGLLATRTNDFPLADSFYTAAIKIISSVSGDSHPDYLTVQNNYCEYLQKVKQYTQSVTVAASLLKKEIGLLNEKLDYLSTSELQAYSFNKSASLLQAASCLHHVNSPELAAIFFDSRLFIKSMAIQNFTNLSKMMERSTDSAIVELWRRYKINKTQLNKLLLQPLAKRSANTDSLSNVVNQEEKALLQRSSEYRDVKEKLTITWQDVRRSLKPADAAVEYVRFRVLNPQNNYDLRYAALLLRPTDSLPLFIDLCSEADLLVALKKFSYTNSSSRVSTNQTAIGTTKNIYQLVWRPMEKYLASITTVYFSPDGLLHGLSFAAIPLSAKQLLIDKYRLVQLTSLREIAVSKIKEKQALTALLFGGIDYNTQITDTAKPNSDAFAYVYQQAHRGTADSFAYLPGSRKEIENISGQLLATQTSLRTYAGAAATEANFRNSCQPLSPSVIHIATHGFTLPDTSAIEGINNSFTASKNPLLRTGLVMAGGNKGWRGRNGEDEDDGILTGLEIAAMQLPNTQLAILSACETANGEIRGSEGVFGLQRAFKLAGVHYVMASLWQVPDVQTTEFMNLFYKTWLQESTIQQAFSHTQKVMRKKYSPYYWASFILTN